MHIRRLSRWFRPVLAAAFLTLLSAIAVAQPPPPTYTVKTSGGLTVVTFNVEPGRIWINLPDDIRPGDLISGTMSGNPKGATKEEQAANLAEMKKFGVRLFGGSAQPQEVRWGDYAGVQLEVPKQPSVNPSVGITKDSGPTLIQVNIPISRLPPGSIFGPDPAIAALAASARWGDYSSFDPASGFSFPNMGQQGRPNTIYGPFDGNASNTSLRFGPGGSTLPDFEKNTENVSGGSGLIRPLAESPRKSVYEEPTNFSGPVQLFLDEGGKKATAPHRNVGVHMRAPKTDLLKGEKTTLTVEVSGLQGIKRPVPLTLTYGGVIIMEGGQYQPLMIQPSEVSADGRYTTTRGITGIQAGGWNATATVVTHPFDICFQDDSVPARVILWNTFTGDYIFNCPGCPPPKGQQGDRTGGTTGESGGKKTGGTTESGGTTTTTGPAGAPGTNPVPPTGLTGTGTMVRKGCIITLTHNAPDRRVFAKLDACTNSANSTVEVPKTDTKFTITDRNTADNTCACGPGCK